MRIYYFVSSEKKRDKTFQEIYRILLEKRVEIFSNRDEFTTGKLSRQEQIKIEQTGEFLIGKMDAIVIEASEFLPEVGYVLALAMGQRLPILYLHKKRTKLNQALSFILQNEHTKRLVTIKEYSFSTLTKHITEFINTLNRAVRREKPTIKFTLRITPRLSRYLAWKAKKYAMSKADYLRDSLLEGAMEADEEYREYEFNR